MTLLCIIPGPSELVKTEADDRPARWCFTCRKRVPHVWHLFKDPEPLYDAYKGWWAELDGYAARAVWDTVSYYDPSWSLRCPKGHSATYFPGCEPL